MVLRNLLYVLCDGPVTVACRECSVGVATINSAVQIRERCTLCAAANPREASLQVINYRPGDLLLEGHPRLDAIGLPFFRTELDQTFIVTAVPTPDARAERAAGLVADDCCQILGADAQFVRGLHQGLDL